MSNQLPPGYVLPNPKVPKLIGLLNMVIGTAMLLVALGYITLAALSPLLADQERKTETAAFVSQKAERDAELAQIKQKQGEVGSDELREQYLKEQAELNSLPRPTAVALAPRFSWEMQLRAMTVFFWVEVVLAVVLNALMIVSGSGLLQLRAWGRRLALWVFGFKIARLVAMSVLSLAFLIPQTTVRVQKQITEILAESGNNQAEVRQNAALGAQAYALMATSTSLGLLVFGAIYPAVALVLLSRKSAWAACAAAEAIRARVADSGVSRSSPGP